MKTNSAPDLQTLANRKDKDALIEAADASHCLDVNDCDDDVGRFKEGVDVGLELVDLLNDAASLAKWDADPEIFLLTFNEYGEDDGVVYFVGSHDYVQRKLAALPDKDQMG